MIFVKTNLFLAQLILETYQKKHVKITGGPKFLIKYDVRKTKVLRKLGTATTT